MAGNNGNSGPFARAVPVADYVGLPFSDDPRLGVHCWGLVRQIYADQLDLDLPQYAEVSASDLIAYTRTIRNGAEDPCWMPVTEPQPYDVVVMRLHTRSSVGHVGLVVDDRHMIHVERSTATVVIPMDHWTVRNRIAGYRRHRRVVEGILSA